MRRVLIGLLALGFACDDGGERQVIEPPDGGLVEDGTVAPDEGPEADVGDEPDGPIEPADGATRDASAADVGAADGAPPVAACQNGEDDDGDGAIDYPADPGCADPNDDDETDPAAQACSDGEDNDGDGLTDADDPGCAGPNDASEANDCGPDQVFEDVSDVRQVVGTTVGRASVLAACRNNMAPEAVFLFTLRDPVERLHFDTVGTNFDTLLSVRSVCDDDTDAAEIACNDDFGGARTSAVDLDRPALGDYFVVLDGFLEEQGDFVLNIRAEVADGAPCPAEDGPLSCRLGATCVDGACTPAACADGVDNDGDGRIDYPNEPGCDTPDDNDETDPDLLPECGDGVDNDFDNDIDYPDDRNCTSAADPSERPPAACGDGIDNDNDGLVDLADPGCTDENDFSEFNIEACRNGEDDDEDGLRDFPLDPGCDSPLDPDETDPEVPRQCSDGLDNDEDGLIDLLDRDSCFFAADDSEDDPCPRSEFELITGLANPRGNTSDAVNDFTASCVGQSGNESLLKWVVAADRELAGMRINTVGSDFDTVLSVRDRCAAPPEDELACDNNSGPGGTSALAIGPQAAGTELHIFVDGGSADRQGLWRAEITALLAAGANCAGGEPWLCADGLTCRADDAGETCQPAACADAVDNDDDGLIDFPDEPGCASPSDDDEADPDFPEQCANAIDDDEDGQIDFPDDRDCEGRGDRSEAPACRDLTDNDFDGSVDYDRDGNGFRDPNADPGCACADDIDEGQNPQCGDGCDNDNDGLIDTDDPGCNDDPQGGSEFNVAQCRDGQDNDGDGLIDFPNDPGCPTPNAPLERNPDPLPECGDGVDNDDDGAIDFAGGAGDDGCVSAADPSEAGPCDEAIPPIPDRGVVNGTTIDQQNDHQGTCSFGEAADVAFRVNVPYPAEVVADSFGSVFDTVVYARSQCLPEAVPAEPEPAGVDAGVVDAGVDAEVDAAVDAAVDAEVDAVVDAGVDAEADAGLDADLDAGVDAAPEDAQVPPDPDMGPPRPPESTELACNDDSEGVQSEIRFFWGGGDFYVFLDGFGNGQGVYTLTVRASYEVGSQCGPELREYAGCVPGSECLPDDDAGHPTCQRNP